MDKEDSVDIKYLDLSEVLEEIQHLKLRQEQSCHARRLGRWETIYELKADVKIENKGLRLNSFCLG